MKLNRRTLLGLLGFAPALTAAAAAPAASVPAPTPAVNPRDVNRIYLSRGILFTNGIHANASLEEHERHAAAIARRTDEALRHFGGSLLGEGDED